MTIREKALGIASAWALSLLVACRPASGQSVAPVAFKHLTKAHDAAFDSTLRLVVRDDVQWSQYVVLLRNAEPPPYVDFRSEMVLFATGPAGGAMDSIQIRQVDRQPTALVVTVYSYFACGAAARSTMPADAVSIPTSSLPVRFNNEGEFGPHCINPGRRKLP